MLDRAKSTIDPKSLMATASRTVGDMFMKRVAATPDRMAWMKKAGGRWETTTWAEFADQALRLTSWLTAHGVAAGDKVCVVGGTRPEWCVADMGGLLAGAVTVGAYPTLSATQLAYLVEHSDSVVVIVEGKAEVDKLLEIRPEIPKVRHILIWDTTGLDRAIKDHAGLLVDWSAALAAGPDKPAVLRRLETIDPMQTAIIVYTSGTTGPPKGAMISHNNIVTLLASQSDMLPFVQEDYGLSFLPMAHVAERVAAFYGRINTGMGTAYATSIPAVLTEVVEVRPTVFGSVPRIFEKAYAKMMAQVEAAPPARQRIFRWAEDVGRQVVRRWQKGEAVPALLKLKYRVADRLVFSKIRAVFGGRVKHFVTGAAPIAYEILEFFWAAGFPIYEVYGMTESTVLTHTNRPGQVRLGSVGKVLSCCQARLADDGEILIKGPTVFQGYYKNPEATAETVVDGWLHTGDIGKQDADGYLYIVDRKKHIIITAGGKNITPANVENEIKTQDPLISQVHAHGDRRAYLTALVTLHSADAVEWARQHGFCAADEADRIVRALMEKPLERPAGLDDIVRQVVAQPTVRERVVAACRRANANLSKVETVKKVALLEREFSVDEDEITPTLKVKRKNVEQKYAPVLDRLYNDAAFGLTVIEGKGGGD